MSMHTRKNYLSNVLQQVEYLTEHTIFIWICGTLFMRLASGMWFGDRPVIVLLTLLGLVYAYMHIGQYQAMLIRFPFVLILLYLGHTHLIRPGDFLLAQPIILSWEHLLLALVALNSSFLLPAENQLFAVGKLHCLAGGLKKASSTPKTTASAAANIVPLLSARCRLSR